MKLRIAACAAAALLAMLPSCAGTQPQGELRVAIPWTPENLDPTMNLSSIRAMVGVTMFDSLVGRDADNRIVPQLAESWQKAGFRPRVQLAERGAYFKRYLGKQFQDARLLGLGGPMQDADELYNLVSSKGRGFYYKNERVDALFDLGRGTMDMAKRRHVYRDLARAMVEDATWVFLLQQVDIYASRDKLTWTPRPDQWMPLHDASIK